MNRIVDQSWQDEQLQPLSDPAAIPRAERRRVELKGYLIRSNKAIVDVNVLDLTYDGCGITTPVPLAPGEKVKISVLGRGAAAASVRWYKGRQAGLLFHDAGMSKQHWPRRVQRHKVRTEASLRRPGRPSFRVSVSDVSHFGCSSEFIERPAIYEQVWIKFAGLEAIESVVCWIEESRVGLMYKNPIHAAVFDVLIARLAPTGPER